MGTVSDAADPLHGVGVLHHGHDGLRGLSEVLAQLGQGLQEELIPSQ